MRSFTSRIASLMLSCVNMEEHLHNSAILYFVWRSTVSVRIVLETWREQESAKQREDVVDLLRHAADPKRKFPRKVQEPQPRHACKQLRTAPWLQAQERSEGRAALVASRT